MSALDVLLDDDENLYRIGISDEARAELAALRAIIKEQERDIAKLEAELKKYQRQRDAALLGDWQNEND